MKQIYEQKIQEIMEERFLNEFQDSVYEQAVEDTLEYLDEGAILGTIGAASVAGTGLGYLSAKRAHKKRKEALKNYKKN